MSFKNYNFILLAGGKSTRFGKNVNKTTIKFRDKPLIVNIIDNLMLIGLTNITVVHNKTNKVHFKKYAQKCKLIEGGVTRSLSVKNAIKNSNSKFTIVHDVARPLINENTILEIIKNLKVGYSCVIPYSDATDTVLLNNKNIDRKKVKLIKTPQGFVTKTLKELHSKNKDTNITDDSELIRKSNKKYKIKYIKEKNENFKLTVKEDSIKLKYLEFKNIKFGIGYDIHRLEKQKSLCKIKLGGVEIQSLYKIISHSDGDVILHSITDSILGALSKRDIGVYFPNNKVNKNRNSEYFLEFAMNKLRKENLYIGNIDIMVVSEKPKINIIYNKIILNLVDLLDVNNKHITLKATTNEKSGLIGNEKFIAVWSSVLLKEF
ncbi:MAG: 2-C-methyl-D-erythritol 2,4-cyclodiphosphate synthase [Alphaproteobacteria bacterium]|nr:2-C-methyl-D-erythritol 2,4-cyclodiphosphate synthase [Alphaproteobacteria bacterium]